MYMYSVKSLLSPMLLKHIKVCQQASTCMVADQSNKQNLVMVNLPGFDTILKSGISHNENLQIKLINFPSRHIIHN